MKLCRSALKSYVCGLVMVDVVMVGALSVIAVGLPMFLCLLVNMSKLFLIILLRLMLNGKFTEAHHLAIQCSVYPVVHQHVS